MFVELGIASDRVACRAYKKAMPKNKSIKVKFISVFLTVVLIGLLVLAGPAQAFTLNISPTENVVDVGEEISFIASLDIAPEERLPVEYLELIIGTSITCRFEPDGSSISGCSELNIVKLSGANFTEGNRTGNFNDTEYGFGFGYGYGYGISESLSYNITLNSLVLGEGEFSVVLKAKMLEEETVFESDGGNLTIVSVGLPSVVINEFESNPDSGGEWVELYNDESFDVDISSWEIWEGIGSEKIINDPIDAGMIIAGKGFYIFEISGSKLNNAGDYVILKDSFGTTIDQTPEFSDSDGDTKTWQRVPDASDNWIFKEETRGFTNEEGVILSIENKTVAPSCVLETDNVTLSVEVSGSCIEEVIFSVLLNETWTNITGTQSEDIYSTTILPELLPVSQFVNWTVYVEECSGEFVKDGEEIFRVNSITRLGAPSPTGLDNWHVNDSQFNLTNPDGNVSYRWDGDSFQEYVGPFVLGIPEGGVHVLEYKSDVCEEEEEEFTGKFDFANPNVEDLSPLPGEIISGDVEVVITALLDDVFPSNSGINRTSVVMTFDGVVVTPTIDDGLGDLDATLTFTPAGTLSFGIHNATIFVMDNAGRSSEVSWSFEFEEIVSFSLTVNSPEEFVYDSRRVPFNLTTTIEVEEISYINFDDSRPRERTICRNCDEYGNERRRTKTLNEGRNEIMFIAVDEFDNRKEKNVTLFVDSRDPRIRSYEPERGFASGNFSVEFDELNPEALSLHYGNLDDFRTYNVNLTSDCVLDRRYECSVWVDLTDYDEQEIEYYFNLTDIAKNNDQSRKTDLDVDMTDPIVNSFSFERDGRRINFVFNITEINFDEVNYIDSSEDRPREKTLCSRLDEGICEKRLSLSDGQHEIEFEILDGAGNMVMRNASVFVDSKSPKITKTEPRRGFSNGLFMVEFKEANPVSLFLNYGNESEVRNAEGDLGSCFEDRSRTKCNITVDLSDFEGQEISYTFNLTDIVGNFDESRERSVEVDTISPVVNSFNYSIDRRRVEFSFNVTELNFDEINYIDAFDSRMRVKRICTRLRDEQCDKRVSFRSGDHSLDIFAFDDAGNSAVVFEGLNFTIV